MQVILFHVAWAVLDGREKWMSTASFEEKTMSTASVEEKEMSTATVEEEKMSTARVEEKEMSTASLFRPRCALGCERHGPFSGRRAGGAEKRQ